eukprot:188341-Amphidinium_carterae.1
MQPDGASAVAWSFQGPTCVVTSTASPQTSGIGSHSAQGLKMLGVNALPMRLSICCVVCVVAAADGAGGNSAVAHGSLAAEFPCPPVRGTSPSQPRICDVRIADITDVSSRGHVLDYIRTQRERTGGSFKVIDVGGSMSQWSLGYREAILDFIHNPNESAHVTQFEGDINEAEGWEELLRYVYKNGKFDFAMCTHTHLRTCAIR